jgi:hypothetical protein
MMKPVLPVTRFESGHHVGVFLAEFPADARLTLSRFAAGPGIDTA